MKEFVTLRSFPPIRDQYRGFDTFAQQFKSREAAESYIRERNTGKRAGVIDSTQRDLLNYSWGKSRFIVTKRGQLQKRATVKQTIRGVEYHGGWAVPFDKDERNPEFQRMTKKMILEDRERERVRRERLAKK